ncbi:MAG TPA: sortase [Ornithinibacter sp.]|nr:sortase [Ornithinibacter sp.]
MPTPIPTSRRRRTPLAACAWVALALLGACSADPAPPTTNATASPSPSAASVTPSPTASRSPADQSPPASDLPQGKPRRVVVTTLGGAELVDATLVPSGLDEDGILAPPAGVAGWYDEKGWPKPGYPGASILAGHINTRATGPDTFAKLPQVRPGARVRVTYSSGDEVDFIVTRSKAVPKEQTPKDDSIWDADNPRPLLRLITCDPTTPVKGGHYVGNWVVWAAART